MTWWYVNAQVDKLQFKMKYFSALDNLNSPEVFTILLKLTKYLENAKEDEKDIKEEEEQYLHRLVQSKRHYRKDNCWLDAWQPR